MTAVGRICATRRAGWAAASSLHSAPSDEMLSHALRHPATMRGLMRVWGSAPTLAIGAAGERARPHGASQFHRGSHGYPP